MRGSLWGSNVKTWPLNQRHSDLLILAEVLKTCLAGRGPWAALGLSNSVFSHKDDCYDPTLSWRIDLAQWGNSQARLSQQPTSKSSLRGRKGCNSDAAVVLEARMTIDSRLLKNL